MFPNNLKSILLLCIAITIVLGQNWGDECYRSERDLVWQLHIHLRFQFFQWNRFSLCMPWIGDVQQSNLDMLVPWTQSGVYWRFLPVFCRVYLEWYPLHLLPLSMRDLHWERHMWYLLGRLFINRKQLYLGAWGCWWDLYGGRWIMVLMPRRVLELWFGSLHGLHPWVLPWRKWMCSLFRNRHEMQILFGGFRMSILLWRLFLKYGELLVLPR